MTANTIVYKKTVDKFSKRFWGYFLLPFIIYSILPLLIIFSVNSINIIVILSFIIVLTPMGMMLFSCYKWSRNKISLITASADNFEIEVITKDTLNVYVIPKQHLNYKTKWDNRRQNALKLTLLNQNTPIADLYSVGRETEEQELETIAYHIGKHRRVHP